MGYVGLNYWLQSKGVNVLGSVCPSICPSADTLYNQSANSDNCTDVVDRLLNWSITVSLKWILHNHIIVICWFQAGDMSQYENIALSNSLSLHDTLVINNSCTYSGTVATISSQMPYAPGGRGSPIDGQFLLGIYDVNSSFW